jgi:ribosomal protein L11 methyltransferase
LASDPLIRLAVRCPPDLAEAVLAELIALAPGGVEEDEGSGYVEYAIYGVPGEIPDLGPLKATVLDAATGRAGGEQRDRSLIEVSSTEVPDDWAERWTDFHKPVLIGERVRVRPSWEAAARDGTIDIVVDPGQAFGTGAHPTTRLCVELLLELASAGRARGPAADWGTGSGVLAIAAAKLGWDPVTGCDHEIAALDAAHANAEANGVELELSRINLRQESPPPAPTAIANLTSPVLLDVAPRVGASQTPATLVCSGMLAPEADSIAQAMGQSGFAERERRESGDWAALLLERA